MAAEEVLDLHMVGSSHLTLIDQWETFRKNQRHGKQVAERERSLAANRFIKWCCGVKKVDSFSGLTLAPIEFCREGWGCLENKTDCRKEQVTKLKKRIQSAGHKNCLFVGGSNDLKWFIVKEGELVSLAQHGRRAWLKLETKDKVNFDPRKHSILDMKAKGFIFEKMQEFGEILSDIFKTSKCTRVFVSSILERSIPEEFNLDPYFAYINFFLKKLISKLNNSKKMCNMAGEPITWFFVNVSDQFYSSEHPEQLFRQSEVEKRNERGLIHRNVKSMEQIINKYLQEIRREALK